jgi:hypothetical protein
VCHNFQDLKILKNLLPAGSNSSLSVSIDIFPALKDDFLLSPELMDREGNSSGKIDFLEIYKTRLSYSDKRKEVSL